MTKEEARGAAMKLAWERWEDGWTIQDQYDTVWDAAIDHAAANQWTYLPELPEEGKSVLVTWYRVERGFVEEATWTDYHKWKAERTDGYNDVIYLEQEGTVIAWCPLPLPAEIKRSDADVEG